MAKRQAKAAREGEDKPFDGSGSDKAHDHMIRRESKSSAATSPLSNQMLDSLEGHLDNIDAATTQAVAN